MSLSSHIAAEPLRSLSNSRLRRRDLEELRAEAKPTTLVGDRLLTAQAMRLLMRLDRDVERLGPNSIRLVSSTDAQRKFGGRLRRR